MRAIACTPPAPTLCNGSALSPGCTDPHPLDFLRGTAELWPHILLLLYMERSRYHQRPSGTPTVGDILGIRFVPEKAKAAWIKAALLSASPIAAWDRVLAALTIAGWAVGSAASQMTTGLHMLCSGDV